MKKQRIILNEWKPDRQSEIPVYRQIVQYMCERIRIGQWEVGSILPTQREMAVLFCVNRSTIRTVMDELSSYGIIESKGKAGTRIISNLWSLMLNHKDWNNTISSGYFRSNQMMIQTINDMEFADGILRLGTGEPDLSLFPKEMWKKALTSIQRIDSLGYLEPLGMYELRCAISDYESRKGIQCKPEQILITSGSLQALQLISACLLKKDSVVYTEEPSYLSSLNVVQSAGILLKGIPMDNEGIRYHMIPTSEKKSRVLYTIPTNQNPTGITMSENKRKLLYEYCTLYRIPIIEDGAYEELYFGTTPKSLKARDKGGMVMYLGTASKTLSPGLRIGWVIAPEAVVTRLGDAKMQMDYGASSVSQLIFLEFLKSGMYQKHCDFLRREMFERRNHAVQIIQEQFGEIAEYHIPEGGFYVWIKFKINISMQKLFEKALKEGILLNPGDIYSETQTRALRLSYAYLGKEEFTKAIRMLSDIILLIS